MASYQPDRYWEERLSKRFNLSGTGHAEFSEYYNRWLYRAKERALAKSLRAHGIAIRGKAVCDIGCGTGFFVDFYRHRGAAHLTGIDITSVSIENLKRRYPKYCFIKGDISSPSASAMVSRRFDIINLFDVLYHITNEDGFDQAIANVSSLCTTGAYIMISDLFGADRVVPAQHVAFRSRGRYEKMLQDNGIECVGMYPLYRILNRSILGSLDGAVWRRVGRELDNLCAPIYYMLNGISFGGNEDSLKLMVARKR